MGFSPTTHTLLSLLLFYSISCCVRVLTRIIFKGVQTTMATRPMTGANIINSDYLILSRYTVKLSGLGWTTGPVRTRSYMVISIYPLSIPCLGIDVRRAAYRDCDGRRTPMPFKGHVSLHRDMRVMIPDLSCLSIRKLRFLFYFYRQGPSTDRINLLGAHPIKISTAQVSPRVSLTD